MLLTSLHPGPDHPHYWTSSISYYTDWKIINYPAIFFPSTWLTISSIVSKKKNKNCVNTIQHNIIDNSYRICYILDFYTDTPVLLQLIAHRDKEDKLLKSLGIPEKIFTVMNKKKNCYLSECTYCPC